MLSNFALCTFDYNGVWTQSKPALVVICFQTLLFVHLITTFAGHINYWNKLWFAFKLCSLYIWLQLKCSVDTVASSCDLLSNFALCTFDYNYCHSLVSCTKVVICFQTLLFVHLITTFKKYKWRWWELWFAFKLCSLYIWLQQALPVLLLPAVVICFQTLLFVHLITTLFTFFQ